MSVGPTSCVVDIRCRPYASFDRLPRLSQGEKPILIQALLPQPAVEAFDESIVSRLPWPAELELQVMAMSPGIERLGDELAAVIAFDRLWQT